jgi:hypothetical protein
MRVAGETNISSLSGLMAITVTVQFNVGGLSVLDTGIVGSNPAQGMDVCPTGKQCCTETEDCPIRRQKLIHKTSVYQTIMS